ncbi:MAG: AI-2E family transporter [Ramlibacter sp.]|nr:AI-2E family transporter [Ramlibacter sp.]
MPETSDARPEPVAAPAEAASPPRVLLHMPVDVRSLSLAILAVLAVLAVLRWASPFFIPLMLGLMFSYALSPLVNALERLRLPRALGAALLLVAILGALGGTAYALTDQANAVVEALPNAARKLGDVMRRQRAAQPGALETVQKAATQLERVAEENGGPTTASRGVTRVQIERPRLNVKDYLWSGTLGLMNLLGQIVVVTFLTYFLLISGDTFRRKLVRIAGPSLSRKKITVQALDEINGQIQRYLLVQLGSSLLVGLVTGLSFWALGLNNAAVWGVAAGVLNLVPYVGSILVTVAAALVAFLQFGQLNMALWVGGASLVINMIEGYLLTPWLTSQTSRMNPVAVFVGVLAWGWLWGVWGLLLGIPILMAVKAICDRVDDLKPVGELLGA